MGFNFGAFAGGLASGIQAGQKMVLDQKKYESEVKSAEEKLKLEGQKLEQEALDKQQKAKDRLADGMVKAEEVMAKDLPIESKLSMFNNISKAYQLGTAKTMLTDPTSGEKFVVDIPQEHLPTVDGIQKDLDIYKNEGNFKIDNTGALYTRPNAESEFTPIGFKGTNAKAFTKEEKPKSSFGVINGKEGYYTEEQLANATAQGMSVERSKDKPSTTSVNVKVEGNKQIYDKLAEFDNENFDLKDKSSVNQAKALSAQLLNDADTETKKQVGQLKSSINTIPTLEKLATKTQALADNLGKVGGDNMASIAVKNLAPYIGDNTSLNKLASMDAKDIASMLKLDVSSAKVIGDYAKDMSGLSLTDSQLKYYKDTVVGGDWSDYKTKALKTKQFIEDEKDRIKTGLESYGDYMMVDKRKFLSGNKETPKTESPTPPKAKQVGLAGNLPVMQDEKGEYIEINGVKKYRGVK